MTGRGGTTRIALFFSCGFAVAASLPSFSIAGDLDSDFQKVCGKTLKQSEKAKQQDPSPKLSYCQSAKSSIEASKAESKSWKVWAGVATVCGAACASSLAGGPTNQYVCISANVAGGLAEAAIIGELASALSSIYGVAGSVVANKMMNDKGEGKKSKDYGACLASATAVIQTYSKHSSMKSQEQGARANLDLAAKETGGGLAVDESTTSSGLTPATGQDTSVNPDTGTLTEIAADESKEDVCNGAGIAAAVACAVAGDSNLPSSVASPRFPSDFQKASGQKFEDFLNKDQSPREAVGMAMSGSMSSAQAGKLAAALDNVENKLSQNVEGTSYASSGGGGGSSGGGESSDPDFGQLMAGIMGQFGGKTTSERSAGIKAVAFANQKRGPSAVVEDRRLSIFDRVTYRYYLVGRRISTGGGK